jgi:crotonobetainyl-CoA:carnitine CoA-transferase CaiB-like acyl-CoA transferase
MPEEAPLPLDGLLVLSLEQAVAAPFATRQLADLGARVVKVERAEGDFARRYDRSVHGQSSYFVWLNTGKQSVCLDLKDAGDLDLVRRIAARADVFVQNLAPGATDRLGLGADVLRAANPRLITCTISGYGVGSPYDDRKAYDLLIQCEAGLLSVTGTPDEPAKTGFSIADICAGMYAYSGVLTALLARARTGVGTSVEVAMLDALAEWMSQPYLLSRYGGRPAARTGARHASIAPYGPFTCSDGSIFLAVQNEREWQRLCAEVLERPELATNPLFATNPDRVENEPALRAVIDQTFGGRSYGQVADKLERAGIANAQLRSAGELHEHPALRLRGRWQELATPGGPVEHVSPPVIFDGAPTSRAGRVPALGEHTELVREEFADAAD